MFSKTHAAARTAAHVRRRGSSSAAQPRPGNALTPCSSSGPENTVLMTGCSPLLTSCWASCLTKSVTNTLCWDMRRSDGAEGSPRARVPGQDWFPHLLLQKHIQFSSVNGSIRMEGLRKVCGVICCMG